MDYQTACKIVIMESKLYTLRGTAGPSQIPAIDAQLARLESYTDDADNTVMAQSDAQFQAAAAALQAQIKPINDAIADITKINTALTTAAQIINDIITVVGVVGHI